MIILITGASHTGKTVLAQKLLEKYQYPYLSIDILKMGLIRSGYTNLTPEDDSELELLLWPIIREMIKTAVENEQNLVIEGSYIPFYWKEDFSDKYLNEIRYYCLVMSQHYIERHFLEIKEHANAIEQRIDDTCCTMQSVLEDNAYYLEMCQKYSCRYILIDEEYPACLEDVAVEIEAETTTYVCQFNYRSFPLIKSCMVHRFFILLGL
ncbi:MAG: adenylate kinase [Acutalibacteraceae bacterium]